VRRSLGRSGVFLLLAVALAAVAVWVLPAMENLVSALISLPDAMSLADMERQARDGR
jgi:hypothetical protein